MPELVRKVEQPAAVIAGKRLVVLPEIGDVIHPRRQALLIEARDIAAARSLDLAEVARKSHLLIIIDALVVEHQHGILVYTSFQRRDLLARKRAGQVDP